MASVDSVAQRVTFEWVLRQLRAHQFAVLSTGGANGRPHVGGVTYGVSRPGGDLALYVPTRRHLQKARDIAPEPRVSLVVPLGWRVPAAIQLRGRAAILEDGDPAATDVLGRSWTGRRILAAGARAAREGETRACFLQITPDPVVGVSMTGHGVRGRAVPAAVRVAIPPDYLSSRLAPPVAAGAP